MSRYDELLEDVAQTLAESFWGANHRFGRNRPLEPTWEGATDRMRENWRSDARDVLDLLIDRRLIPVEFLPLERLTEGRLAEPLEDQR